MSAYNLISLGGIAVLLGIGWLLSEDRTRLPVRAILWGVGLQFAIAALLFLLPAGRVLFQWLNDAVVAVLQAASSGSRFLFGALALPPGAEGSLGFFLAFQALPTIVFFSALVSVLYHYRVLPALVRLFARVFTRLMRISGAESLCAASNVFVGVESALTVRPHLADMTRSELCTVLTAGMATVASNVLALYVFTLREQFPTIAGHLISASLLSAPAAIVMAKLLVPERGAPRTLGMSVEPEYERAASMFEAVIQGARAGVQVIVGVAAVLLAVLGLVALVDLGLGGLGTLARSAFGWTFDVSLAGLLGQAFRPFVYLMGVPPADASIAAKLIGERAVLTEVVAYQHLAGALAGGTIVHPRTAVIVAYALCGFAHLASLAIFVGGVSALAPTRTADIAAVGVRALVAATLACLMTGCVAGAFYTGSSLLTG